MDVSILHFENVPVYYVLIAKQVLKKRSFVVSDKTVPRQ